MEHVLSPVLSFKISFKRAVSSRGSLHFQARRFQITLIVSSLISAAGCTDAELTDLLQAASSASPSSVRPGTQGPPLRISPFVGAAATVFD